MGWVGLGWVGLGWRFYNQHKLYQLNLTGKHTAIFEKFPQKLNLNGKHVVKSGQFVQIGQNG
jgi:hypothetical protein